MKISHRLYLAASAVWLAISPIIHAQADVLDQLKKTTSQVSEVIEHASRTNPERTRSAKRTQVMTERATNAIPRAQADPKAAAPSRAANPGTDELAFPILADGSLFLSPRIGGNQIDDWGRQRERLFGDGPSLSGVGRMLLLLAHGVGEGSHTDPDSAIADAVRVSTTYRQAQDDFERRDILAAKKPCFARALADLRQVTNATLFVDLPWGFHYALEKRMYVHHPDRNKLERIEQLRKASVGVGCIDTKGGPWRAPEGFAFSPEQAEQINDEVKSMNGSLTVAILIRGVFCSQQEFNGLSRNGARRESQKEEHLLVRITNAEAFLVLNPQSKSGQAPRLRRLGHLTTD